MDTNGMADLQALELRNKVRIWEPFMRKYQCDIICELGVRSGVNFKELIRHNPQLAIAVDSWKDDGIASRNDLGFTQQELNQQFNIFTKDMEDKSFVKILREYTFDAVKYFEDNFFDFVYIDADHTYEACLKDLEDWFPKVKRGGFLVGDDYRVAKQKTGVEFGVIPAVQTFTQNNNMTFFELPRYGWGIIKN